jgi:hypothetical protein
VAASTRARFNIPRSRNAPTRPAFGRSSHPRLSDFLFALSVREFFDCNSPMAGA